MGIIILDEELEEDEEREADEALWLKTERAWSGSGNAARMPKLSGRVTWRWKEVVVVVEWPVQKTSCSVNSSSVVEPETAVLSGSERLERPRNLWEGVGSILEAGGCLSP